MSVNSNTLHSAGRDVPGRVGAIAGSGTGIVTPVVHPIRAGRLPEKHHSVKRKMVPPPPHRAKPHEIIEIHFARKDETCSRLLCRCGEWFSCEASPPYRSHSELYDAHSLHKAAACRLLEEAAMS